MAKKRRGVSYQMKVAEVNRTYDAHAKDGLSNREIWRRYVYPRWGISERTFYNLLTASCEPKNEVPREAMLFLDFDWDDPASGEDKETKAR